MKGQKMGTENQRDKPVNLQALGWLVSSIVRRVREKNKSESSMPVKQINPGTENGEEHASESR